MELSLNGIDHHNDCIGHHTKTELSFLNITEHWISCKDGIEPLEHRASYKDVMERHRASQKWNQTYKIGIDHQLPYRTYKKGFPNTNPTNIVLDIQIRNRMVSQTWYQTSYKEPSTILNTLDRVHHTKASGIIRR